MSLNFDTTADAPAGVKSRRKPARPCARCGTAINPPRRYCAPCNDVVAAERNVAAKAARRRQRHG